MSEVTKLAIEVIKELMKLSVPEINEVRTEWLGKCRENRKVNQDFINTFVNYACDFAIGKLSKTA